MSDDDDAAAIGRELRRRGISLRAGWLEVLAPDSWEGLMGVFRPDRAAIRDRLAKTMPSESELIAWWLAEAPGAEQLQAPPRPGEPGRAGAAASVGGARRRREGTRGGGDVARCRNGWPIATAAPRGDEVRLEVDVSVGDPITDISEGGFTVSVDGELRRNP